MDGRWQELHKLVDALPEGALRRAEDALKYCADPGARRFTIERAKKRVREMSLKKLEERARQTGGCVISVEGDLGVTAPNGDFRGSMTAWDDCPVTYHLHIFHGYRFEVYERLELAKDGTQLVLTQRIVGPDGAEQTLTVHIPVPL